MFNSKNKRCPRCNTKVPKEIVTCPGCRLNYQKFEKATNGEAKIAYKMGEGERVVMRKGVPTDVNKFKLIMLTIFLGFTGAHYYYVGRKRMGVFFSIFFVIGLINAILTGVLKISTSGDLYQLFYLLVLVWGAVIIMWIIDIFKVAFNTFKVPVSLSRF